MRAHDGSATRGRRTQKPLAIRSRATWTGRSSSAWSRSSSLESSGPRRDLRRRPGRPRRRPDRAAALVDGDDAEGGGGGGVVVEGRAVGDAAGAGDEPPEAAEALADLGLRDRSEEHTSELQSRVDISYP